MDGVWIEPVTAQVMMTLRWAGISVPSRSEAKAGLEYTRVPRERPTPRRPEQEGDRAAGPAKRPPPIAPTRRQPMKFDRFALAFAALAFGGASTALAAPYPERPIKVVVAW